MSQEEKKKNSSRVHGKAKLLALECREEERLVLPQQQEKNKLLQSGKKKPPPRSSSHKGIICAVSFRSKGGLIDLKHSMMSKFRFYDLNCEKKGND